jgi:hypothetical protein
MPGHSMKFQTELIGKALSHLKPLFLIKRIEVVDKKVKTPAFDAKPRDYEDQCRAGLFGRDFL